MNSALAIAEALDRHLTQPTPVIVFGSGALLLDPRFASQMAGRATNDIDIIIPSGRELVINSDTGFWTAIESTNRELEPKGFYITHIFPEAEVALTPEWSEHLVNLPQPSLSRLILQRPRVLDLVVSKMGRGDMQDLADVRSYLQLNKSITGQGISAAEVASAASRARVPAVYQDIFPAASKRIANLAREVEIEQSLPLKISQNQQLPGPKLGL